MRMQISRFGTFAVAAIAASLAVGGCTGKAASVRQERARALAASAPRATVASAARTSEHFAKPAPRDPAFARYSDPEYGVAFRYPRNFALLESEASDSDGDGQADSDRMITWEQAKQAGAGVRTAEELGSDDPGAALLATIVVPDDAYPNTSFAGGSLQFAINRYQTASSCRSNLLSHSGDAKVPSGTLNGQGVSFAWIDVDTGDGNTEFHEREYAGFANEACYEFFLRVGVRSSGAGDATVQNVALAGGASGATSDVNSSESVDYRRPDERKIVAHLEKIITSLEVERASASVLDRPRYKSAPALPASN